MDKVDFTGVSLFGASLRPGQKPETKKARAKDDTRGVYKTRFSEVLEDAAANELGPIREMSASEEALTELMDAVHSAGSDLRDRPFHDEIIRYKKAVRNFVNYVIENGYEFYKSQGIKKKVSFRGESEWKDMPYNQIRVVDQKLEELAAAVLSGQADQLQRVAKMEEITGLLVDLTISGAIRKNDG